MILYKAIKYKIIDFCLDALFSNIHKNTSNKNSQVTVEQLFPGMYLSEVSYGNSIKLTGCMIQSIEQDMEVGGVGKFVLVTFTFTDKYLGGNISERTESNVFSKYIRKGGYSNWKFII